MLGLFVGSAAFAATITVNSLADPGQPGICALRDAITAANTMTATNGCAAGTGNDTIDFSPRMTGTILLVSTLPEVTDSLLTINGPASRNITISGSGLPPAAFLQQRVMEVAADATLNLTNLSIANGFTFMEGAGIDNAGTLTVANSFFSGNSAILGGGIFNGGVLTVTNSTFSKNSGTPPSGQSGAGGAIYNAGTTKIIKSTFSGNFGKTSGGAIANVGALTVINSTFFGNATSVAPIAGDGAGIQNSGTLTVTNSTFSSNGGGPGGGISNVGIASLKNTILAESSGGPFNPPSNCFGAITDAGYNISDDSTCRFSGTGSANNGDGVNPLLSTAGLADNGGPTQTIALQSGSPAIDAISVTDCTDQALPPDPITTDQRGFPRPDAGEQVCDIGAYEFQDFAGQPGARSCQTTSVAALTEQFGSLDAAASGLGFSSVNALQSAIVAFCKG
ncbi:MAG: right-handed parallel beta-helix repeat-containing protein [Deltaproteobacteria bacterium]|nr:right-handed parallel beta-helix repeat-containing protein [Deltaproteobacteria bacterium]